MEYQVGDLVLAKLHLVLQYRDIHKGLIHLYEGPVRVLQWVEKVAYKLELPLKPFRVDKENLDWGESHRAPVGGKNLKWSWCWFHHGPLSHVEPVLCAEAQIFDPMERSTREWSELRTCRSELVVQEANWCFPCRRCNKGIARLDEAECHGCRDPPNGSSKLFWSQLGFVDHLWKLILGVGTNLLEAG